MKSRILFTCFVIVLAAGGFVIRAQNAVQAASQVAQIQNLDAADTDTTTALAKLKNFVDSHMGASVHFTLTASYQRAQAVTQSATAVAAANAQVYAAAQAACSGHTDSITQAECNQNYLSQHLKPEPNTQSLATPQLASYQYNWSAPVWTPDLAGALFLGAGAALVTGLIYHRPRRQHRRLT